LEGFPVVPWILIPIYLHSSEACLLFFSLFHIPDSFYKSSDFFTWSNASTGDLSTTSSYRFIPFILIAGIILVL